MNRDVSVQEVMDREYLAASESDGLLEVVEVMLREEREPAVVLRGSDPVGILTDRDVLAMLVDGDDAVSDASVGDAMTETVPTIDPDETLAAARDRMASWSTHWLVVSDGGEPDGVVTEHDVLSTSTLGTEADATETPAEPAEQFVGASGTATTDANAAESDTFEDQSICEMCGSFSHDLSAINGQLLCADCRDI